MENPDLLLQIHVSNDGRFLYVTNRNLTDAALIQDGDVSHWRLLLKLIRVILIVNSRATLLQSSP